MIKYFARATKNVTALKSDTVDLPEKASFVIVTNTNANAEDVKLGYHRSPSAPIESDTFSIPGKSMVTLNVEVARLYSTGTGADIIVHACYC
jgi:hypothetical protein